ncbi:uncharacterized protein C8A04DRAFT_27811 [Dichotomopilus funicola]|uniref:Uncharacterized protein n=1 Tax=Dichotomopilus funicola TaxID=1934379 RepID=A0AAN6V3Z6_9PEZI|nr:hypothetical protein C8A04DRAFT_27811 [Dichotomopilus funicola]
MKFSALSLSLLASVGLATPVRRDVAQSVYTLRLSSTNQQLDGLYLTAAEATAADESTGSTITLSVYTSSHQGPTPPAVKFYPVANPSTKLNELHTAGDNDDGSTLAVVGSNGLLDFSLLVDPHSVELPDGTTADWTSFALQDEGASRDDGTVEYAGQDGGSSKGNWVAFPVGGAEEQWTVKWKDETAWTTSNWMPVDVVYELIKNE